MLIVAVVCVGVVLHAKVTVPVTPVVVAVTSQSLPPLQLTLTIVGAPNASVFGTEPML